MLKTRRQLTIAALKDEVSALVARGSVDRSSKLSSLASYFDETDWQSTISTLEVNEYLLRDHVCDLIGCESWKND